MKNGKTEKSGRNHHRPQKGQEHKNKKGSHPQSHSPDLPGQVLTSHEIFYRKKNKQQNQGSHKQKISSRQQEMQESLHNNFPQQQMKHPNRPRFGDGPYVEEKKRERKDPHFFRQRDRDRERENEIK